MLVFVVHLIASRVFGIYSVFPNIDIPAHFMGGFAIAFTAIQILSHLEKEKIIPPSNVFATLVLTFALTATATVLWEFAEFTGDQLFGTNIQVSLANTMQDQCMGIVGGLTWMVIHYWKPFAVRRAEKIKRSDE
jgi:hypothetical protein